MRNLKALQVTRKTGTEPFHINGARLPQSLINFWQWSASNVVGNALRGMLAEYIVATAVDRAEDVRMQWDAYDILTKDGIKIEVKSGAYIQSWTQAKHLNIVFGIQPTQTWDAELKKRTNKRMRQADVYVFCVLKHQNKETVDPQNMAQWDFYVLST
jgi:hypothetical protein